MFILDLLAAIGSVMLRMFRGRTGRVARYLEPVAESIIRQLDKTDLTAEERFKLAFGTLANFAIGSGAEAADHAINLVIEWELAEGRGKNIKKIFDEGLQQAREVVADVGKLAIESDMGKKREAAERLRMRLTHDMKMWLTNTNTLYLLIEAAVAETKE